MNVQKKNVATSDIKFLAYIANQRATTKNVGSRYKLQLQNLYKVQTKNDL